MIISKDAAEKAKARRAVKAKLKEAFTLSGYLFPEQLAFVQDPAPNKVAVCSRRSGKTIACAAHLIDTAVNHPGVVCLYITLSRSNAKKIIWREMKKINRDYKLGGLVNETELCMSFGDSIIYLSGAKDTNEIEKFRGLAIKLVYIDEAQSFRSYIRELIDDILAPALMDYAGTLCLIGTPGPIPTGYFHDAFIKTGTWARHAWTFWNNPFILEKSKLTHRQMLDRELTRRGVTIDDPSIQREWFGKWVLDSDSLLVHYDDKKNHYVSLPDIAPQKYSYIMGIDLGFDDADAIAVLAWCDKSKTTYLVEELVIKKQGITELVEQVNALWKKYTVSKMVIDQGGLGKKIAEEMRRRHHIPVQAADKTRKMENIAFLNDALRTGLLMAKSNSKFAEDSRLVEIDRDKSTPDKVKISSKYHSDIIDAVLYAFRESPAYTYVKPEEGPKYGTLEWQKKEQESMWESAQTHFEELAEQARQQNGDFE